LVGMAIVIPAARRGWLQPKEIFDFRERDNWETQWLGTVKVEQAAQTDKHYSALKAFSPYILVVLLLVITRPVGPVKALLTGSSATLDFPALFGTSISSSAQVLFSPGMILIIASLACIGIFGMSMKQYGRAL